MNDLPPPIDSRHSFAAAVCWGFKTAIGQNARRIYCTDADFANWPLEDAALQQQLGIWLRRPQRRLTLLALNFDEVPRRQPRFARWRRCFVHAIDSWQAPPEAKLQLPTLLVSDGAVCVHLVDALQWRGGAALGSQQAHAWRDQIDAVLQRSEPAFAANTSGL